MVGQPHDVLARMVASLVQQLPIDFLSKGENIGFIAKQFKESLSDTQLDKKKLAVTVENITSAQRDEMNIILDQILQNVFGEGIDYLYFINQ